MPRVRRDMCVLASVGHCPIGKLRGSGQLGLGIWEGLSGGTNQGGRTGPNEQAATATVRDDRLRRARGVARSGYSDTVSSVCAYRDIVLVDKSKVLKLLRHDISGRRIRIPPGMYVQYVCMEKLPIDLCFPRGDPERCRGSNRTE